MPGAIHAKPNLKGLDQMNSFAVVEFYKSGKVFPVRISISTSVEAERLCQWMRIGCGEFQDWRVIPMAELRELLNAGRVTLEGFTKEAQAKRVAAIEAQGHA